MSAVPQTLSSVAGVKPMPMRLRVVGRIDSTRTHEGDRFTRVLTPAPDAYSRPQVLEIRSKGRDKIGEAGDEVDVQCTLGGYPRKPFRVTDASGETRLVTPIEHTLELVP